MDMVMLRCPSCDSPMVVEGEDGSVWYCQVCGLFWGGGI